MSISSIMTVCIGNICRSPVAEGLMRQALPECKVWSSGLHAVIGASADPTAQALALDVGGIDISAHRAQQVQAWMCTQADLILVMEATHLRELTQRYPLARGKICLLGEFGSELASAPYDIADPYQQPRAAFEAAHTAIAQGVAQWASRIRLIA
jgi:protein-tyrosine phosphatase